MPEHWLSMYLFSEVPMSDPTTDPVIPVDPTPGDPAPAPVTTIGQLILDDEAKAAAKVVAQKALDDATVADKGSFNALASALAVVGPTARPDPNGGFTIYRADGSGGLAPVEHVSGFDTPVPVQRVNPS